MTEWSYVSEIAISILGYEHTETFQITPKMTTRGLHEKIWNAFRLYLPPLNRYELIYPSEHFELFVENEGYLTHRSWAHLTLSCISFPESYSGIILSEKSKVYLVIKEPFKILKQIKISKTLSSQISVLDPDKIERCLRENKKFSRFHYISSIQSLFHQIPTWGPTARMHFVRDVCSLRPLLESTYQEIPSKVIERQQSKNRLLEMVDTSYSLMLSYLDIKELFRLKKISPFMMNSITQEISNRCVKRNSNNIGTPSWEFLSEIFNYRRNQILSQKNTINSSEDSTISFRIYSSFAFINVNPECTMLQAYQKLEDYLGCSRFSIGSSRFPFESATHFPSKKLATEVFDSAETRIFINKDPSPWHTRDYSHSSS